MLEHCGFFWRSFGEMSRVCSPTGMIFLIAPSAGPIHRYPVDCYRFYPDAYRALAKHAGVHLVEVFHDDRGPWADLVGVFSKLPREPRPFASISPDAELAVEPAEDPERSGETLRSGASYLDALSLMHDLLEPRSYWEIGVRKGRSLALARCPAVGIDPYPEVANPPENAEIFSETSDSFFANGRDKGLISPDLAFIDGMHLFEYAIRDFIHLEERMQPDGVIVVDDVAPRFAVQAERQRRTRAWTGDVWKLEACLRKHRPDLKLTRLTTAPCGLLVVRGLNPRNRTLRQRYNPICREFMAEAKPPETLLNEPDLPPEALEAQVRQALGRPSGSKLKLSVVVCAYDMKRELPRTLETLSTAGQQDVTAEDYEIIVVDNGSPEPVDEASFAHMEPKPRVLRFAPGNPSPVAAINGAVATARADRIAVFIDGARMASPRLIAEGLAALEAFPNAVVGALAYHLGSEPQMASVQKGYDQNTEDALLESVDWRQDGYALFSISVPGGSSAARFARLPSESNSFFIGRKHWRDVGGFDERFRSAGGGLANLDLWKRLCEHRNLRVVLLESEATFHQVHGGVATNAPKSRWPEFNAEYESIRGQPFSNPSVPFIRFATGSAPSLYAREMKG
jgi:glycosyltransferase involved in cell wall biosynthesis